MSAFADVVDTLVTTFSALPALAGVSVYDGPPLSMSGDLDLVLIGHDGDPGSTADEQFVQDWVDLACTRRAESGDVVCAAVSQTGDVDLRARRDRAKVLVAACENALRADMTLGGAVDSAIFVSGSARQLQNANGSAVVVPFTITYRVNV